MGQSYKNTSSGGSGKDSSGAHYLGIGENKAHVPPAGSSNSYEKVRRKIDASDDRAIGANHYTREKMDNK
jgi:hypothetical protein